MPSCQAFNCTNEKGKCGKSFFVIPNPTKSTEKRRVCKQWINNLKNVKLKFETFIFNSNKVVCEDHFTADSYDRNLVAESLNFKPKKKRLLPTAVPTLINTTIRKRRKVKNMGKYCTIGEKKKKGTDTQTGEKTISRKKKKYKRVITQPDNVKSHNDERSKIKEVTSSSLANNNMLKDQETQTIENTLHLPVPDNVKSNNDEVKMEGVTPSSLAVNNKIHVDQETQTIEGTPFLMQLGKNIVWAFVSGSKGGNSSHYMGDNSTSHLLNDQVSVPSLQTNNQETDRLNEDQSVKPQLDNTDDCLTVLSNTVSRLEDLGAEIAAWVLVPNNVKSSLIHHMGSQRGREFIKSKPDINAQLHVFLQNSKKKGLDDDSSCFKDQQADNSIQEDLPCVASSRKKKEKTLKRKISSVYMGDHAYCKNKTTSVLRNILLDDSRKPTSSSSPSAMDMGTINKSKEIQKLKSFKFQNEEQESYSVVKVLDLTNMFTSFLPKSGIKNMAENTLLLDKHSSTAEKSNLEIRGDNLINKIKEEPVDYEFIEFQNVKPREIVTENTVQLDTHSSTAEKSNLEIKGDNSFTHIQEPVDHEFIEFQEPSRKNSVTDNSYTHNIKEPMDYGFIEFEVVKPREIVTENTVCRLNETCCTMESDNNKIMTDTQKRFPQTSLLLSNSSFVPAKEIDLLKSFEFQKQVQVPHSNQKDVPSTNIFTPLFQPTGDKNMVENTLLLDTHSSTTEKSNLEIRGEDSFTHIKEEPVDHEFIDFQEANHNNNVTENTAQLDTHSSTAEKSTVRLKEDLFSNDIKEEPIDYEFIETEEVKHRKIATENTVQLDTHSSTGGKSTGRLKEDLISDRIKEDPVDYEFQEVKHRKLAELDSPVFSEILQTEQTNTYEFAIRSRCDEVKTESSNCNSNVAENADMYSTEIAETEQSNTDDFGIRSRFDEEKKEISNNNLNIHVGGTIEGYKVFLNNANESIDHVTSGL